MTSTCVRRAVPGALRGVTHKHLPTVSSATRRHGVSRRSWRHTYRTGPPGKPATSVPLSCTAVATITLLWFYVAVTVWFRPSCISCIFHINLFFIFWFLQFSFCCLLFHGGQFNGLVAFLVTVKWIWWMMMVVMILANADLLTFSSPTCYRYFKILYTVTRNPQIVLLLEIQGRV